MRIDRDKKESKAFDEAVLIEYARTQDQEHIIPQSILSHHLNLFSPPFIGYRYALYLLKDDEIRNQDVLNIACGTGYESVILAKKGAKVFAFDISLESVKIAQKKAILNKVSEKIHTEIMSVYDLGFSDETFKYVYGCACLHHFDREKALKEIHRVMKPGGMAVFFEPYSGSKWLKRFREFIPVKKAKISPDEDQLTDADIREVKKIFKEVTITEYGLFNRLQRLCSWKWFGIMLCKIDAWILIRFPVMRKFARNIVIKVVK